MHTTTHPLTYTSPSPTTLCTQLSAETLCTHFSHTTLEIRPLTWSTHPCPQTYPLCTHSCANPPFNLTRPPTSLRTYPSYPPLVHNLDTHSHLTPHAPHTPKPIIHNLAHSSLISTHLSTTTRHTHPQSYTTTSLTTLHTLHPQPCTHTHTIIHNYTCPPPSKTWHTQPHTPATQNPFTHKPYTSTTYTPTLIHNPTPIPFIHHPTHQPCIPKTLYTHRSSPALQTPHPEPSSPMHPPLIHNLVTHTSSLHIHPSSTTIPPIHHPQPCTRP